MNRDFRDFAVGLGDGDGDADYAILALVRSNDAVQPIHKAFRFEQRADVDRFHAAALELGAEDNGTPGLRPHYHASYYGAFVRDPDGHNLEAVCHLVLDGEDGERF